MLLTYSVSDKHTNFNKHTTLLGNLGPYLQQLIFFLTYKFAQYGRALNDTGQKGFPVMKRSSLFGAFISYEENEVL
jgi:hypothetical protein